VISGSFSELYVQLNEEFDDCDKKEANSKKIYNELLGKSQRSSRLKEIT